MPSRPAAVGLLVQQRRKEARLSRAALARLASLSESTVKNVESGRHEPMVSTLMALSTALKMPELVGPQASVVELLETTGAEALADLIRHYSPQVLAAALRLAGVDVVTLAAEHKTEPA